MEGSIKPALVTEPRAREYLGGCSRQTIYNLRAAGLIKPVFLGRAVRYSLENLDQVIRKLQREEAGGVGGNGCV